MSAFLQIAGPQGTTYGNICASCRKILAEKPAAPKEKEESTRSDTGHQIDTKTKIAEDIDKKQQRQKIEEEYHKERDKDEELETEKIGKIETLAKDEKKHRETYLEKRSFLRTEKKTEAQRITESRKQETQRAVQQALSSEEIIKQEQAIKEEKVKTGIDLTTGPYLPSQTGEIKYQSRDWLGFKAWLGASSPIVQNAEQAAQKSQELSAKQEQSKKLAEKTNKDPLIDYVDKTWGPKSRGR